MQPLTHCASQQLNVWPTSLTTISLSPILNLCIFSMAFLAWSLFLNSIMLGKKEEKSYEQMWMIWMNNTKIILSPVTHKPSPSAERLQLAVCMHVCVCVCFCVCACMHTSVCVCECVRMHVLKYMHVCTCVCVCMCLCVHACMCTSIWSRSNGTWQFVLIRRPLRWNFTF